MGMYTGLRGAIRFKEQFRNEINRMFTESTTLRWKDLKLPHTEAIHAFVMEGRAGFIPFGVVCYMPCDWEHKAEYDEVTGVMRFCCSLKNYEGEIGKFIEAIPDLAEWWELESLYEEDDEPTLHTSH